MTTLPFTYKVRESCLDGGEHQFKAFPKGESAEDTERAAESIERPRRSP